MSELTQEERVEVAREMRHLCSDASQFDSRARHFVREADRFENCGLESLIVACDVDFTKYSIPIRCRSRICDDCGRDYYGHIVQRLRDVVSIVLSNKRKGYYGSLLTLTVQKDRFGGRMPTPADIRRIYSESAQFFRLFCGRYGAVFTKKGRVREDRKKWIGGGSLSVVDIAPDNNNLHIHAIVYMPFTPWSVMKAAWLKITGDSCVLRLDPAKSVNHVVKCLLPYATKVPETDSLSRLAQYAWMIKGSRRLRSSGMFYNHLCIKKVRLLAPNCPLCGGKLRQLCYGKVSELGLEIKSLWGELRAAGRLLPPQKSKLSPVVA